MSITIYSELKTAVADFLNRDDLTAIIPTFISLAEARIARDLRHWKQDRRVTTDVDERYENLPSDWISIHLVEHTDGGEISSVSNSEMAALRSRSTTTGKPRHFKNNANDMEFYPAPDATYNITVIYQARIPSLSEDADTNWLLLQAPDVMLYAALMQSAPYLADDNRTQVWSQLYQSAVQALNTENQTSRMSGTLSMRIPR